MRSVIYRNELSATVSSSVVHFTPLMYLDYPDASNPNNQSWGPAENKYQQPIPIDGVLKEMRVKLNAAPGAGKSFTFSLRQNATSSGGPSVTISDTSTTGSDLINTLSVSAGDLLGFMSTPNNSPTSVSVQITLIFESNAANNSIILGGGDVFPSLNTFDDLLIGSVSTADPIGLAGFRNQVFPTSGRIKNLYVNMWQAAGVGNRSLCYVVQNGSLTALAVAIAHPNLSGNNTTDSIYVNAGDILSFRVDLTTDGSTGSGISYGMEFIPDTDKESIFAAVNVTTPSSSVVNYTSAAINNSTNIVGWSAVEDANRKITVDLSYLKKLFIDTATAPGVGKSYIFVVMVNGVASALSATISDTSTTASNIATQITVQAGDLISIRSTPSGSPGSLGRVRISLVTDESANPLSEPCSFVDLNTRFKLDYVVDAQRPAQDVLNDMLATFGGFLVYAGSKVKLRVEKTENVTQYFGDGSTTDQNATFDPNNIVKESFNWNMSSTDDRPNRVRVQWVDPDQNYVKVYTQVEDRIDQDDRGTVITKDISLLGITRASQAARMAKFIMASSKYAAISVSFSARLESIHCEVGDVVAVTHQAAKFTRKLFRISQMQEGEDEGIRFVCKEYNPSIYDDHVGAGAIQMATPAFFNPYAPLSDPTNLILTESGFLINGGIWITNINVQWTAISADQLLNLGHYLIQVSSDGGANYVDVGSANAQSTNYTITLGNAQTGIAIYVRIKTVSLKGILSLGNNAASITLQGKTTPPSNVTNFNAVYSTDHVAMSWTQITDSDLFGYEIRVGPQGSSWETASVLITAYLGTKYDSFNAPAGAKTFFIKAIDNSGNYSATAASVNLTVPGSSGSAVTFSYDIFSKITVIPDPLEGSLSSELDKIPTTDYSSLYNKLTLQPKTANTFLDLQNSIGTWLGMQNSGFVFGREVYVTSQESFQTTVIDIGSITTGTFVMDYQTYSRTNKGVVTVQISTSQDGITYTSFVAFVSGQYTARYVIFKFLIQAITSSVVVRLVAANFLVMVP